jgi:hypothetical protein
MWQFSASPTRPAAVPAAPAGPVRRLPYLAWRKERAVSRAGVSGCIGHGRIREWRHWPGARGESLPQEGPKPARPCGELFAGGQGLIGPELAERAEQPRQVRIRFGQLLVDRLKEPLLAAGKGHRAPPIHRTTIQIIVSLGGDCQLVVVPRRHAPLQGRRGSGLLVGKQTARGHRTTKLPHQDLPLELDEVR